MVGHLGLMWARRHLAPYSGKLLAVPDADLPALLAQAEADAAAVKAAGLEHWSELRGLNSGYTRRLMH
ncbi:MAG TPA: hypothetical protein VE650_03155 [Acetobacteraceae bacterium]|nr:hypothetical protein [Acetobacteraceae bacterium]